MTKAEKIILGIDPGTNVMGYGVIRVEGNKAEMVTMGVIDLRKMSDPYLRLGHIFTGNGQASKEQVAGMLTRLLKLNAEELPQFLDATDALGAAYCHFMQMGKPASQASYRGWKDFVNKNQDRLCKKPSTSAKG